MSLIPFILDLADELHEFSRCLAHGIDINDFGFGLYAGADQQQQQQASPRRRHSSFSTFWMPSKRHHPYNRIKTACCAKSGEDGVASTEKSDITSVSGTPGKSASYSVVNKNGFQVSMNVKQFAPNELSVKTIDNCIVVEGRHDDKEDGHGVISRHFVRKYMLPKGYDPNDVLSTLSSDGILTVKAPPPPPAAKNDETNERVIEIQPTTGPTPVLASAKETNKFAVTPPARFECHLPEKRQKLDISLESKDSVNTKISIPPSTFTENESDLMLVPAAEKGKEVKHNDIEMEKADEQITDILVKHLEQQQISDVAEIENSVEKKEEIIEHAEKLQKKEYEKNGESYKKFDKSNGGTKKIENVSSDVNAARSVENIIETVDKTKIDIVTKIDVDCESESKNYEKGKINCSEIVATTKTANNETNSTMAAATNVTVKNTGKEPGKTNNTHTSINNAATTTTTNIAGNNGSSVNSSSNANSSTPEVVAENSAKDVKTGNGVVNSDIPDNIPNSPDVNAANNTTTKNIKDLDMNKAESVADVEIEIETAVFSINTPTNFDDVALLKVTTTADPTTIADNESIDDTTTTDLNTNVNTNAAIVDDVECSLFAKKHLDNGNNTTATPVVGTEEITN